MPVYEYECKSCNKTLEVMQRFDEPLLSDCDSCGGELRKLISNTSFVLKGNGWYITDYARKSEGGTDKADGGKADGDRKADTASQVPSHNCASSEAKSEPNGAAVPSSGKTNSE